MIPADESADSHAISRWCSRLCRGLAVAFVVSVTPLLAHAVELDQIEAQLGSVEVLCQSASSMHEWELDGLNLRIDQLGLDSLKQLNDLARLSLAESAANDRFIGLLDQAAEMALQRVEYLDDRAARERATIEKFEQSAEADIARAFINDLDDIRQEYLLAFVRQAEIRRNAGLEPSVLVAEGRRQILLILEPLTGQIRLDAMSLDELHAALSEDPQNDNLLSAIALVQQKQNRSLDVLEKTIVATEALGIDADEQRALLLRERGELGIDLIQRGVLVSLWREAVTTARDSIIRNGPDVLFRTFVFTLLLLLAWLAAKATRIVLRVLLHEKRVEFGALRRDMLISTSGAIVFGAGAIISLAVMGVSLGPLFAGIGVVGILAGLALQDSLSNLAAGAMILIYRPYDVDDYVKTSGGEGLVKRMNLLATTVATFDNESLIVPNGRIWGDTIVNYTAARVRRVDTEVGVAYSTDLDRVVATLLDLMSSLDYVLGAPEPMVHIAGMQDSSITVIVKPWVRTEDYWSARFDLPMQIKKRLDAEGIEIPFPQRVVTLAEPDRRPVPSAGVSEPAQQTADD